MTQDEKAAKPDELHAPPDHRLPDPTASPDHRLPAATNTRKRRWWIWMLVLLLFAALFWVVWFRPAAKPAPANPKTLGGTVPVTTATAKLGNIGVYLEAIGTVTPENTDSVTAQVTGVITTVHYRQGQTVHRGDPLIDIDARPYEAQVIEAEGALERDKNLLAQAQMDLERYQKAWARNAIPQQTLQDQEKLALQYQGTVKIDEGTLRYNQVQVAYCHITSPIDGRVGLRLVDPGNLVTANATTALVVVTQMQPMTVIFTLAQDSLGEVLAETRQGTKLQVEAWDRQMAKQLALGQLYYIDNQVDTATGTVKLRAAFDNKKDELFPNQFVNTRLRVKVLNNQVLVPTSAVQHNGNTAFVYMIQNNVAKMTTVQTGVTDSGMTAVTGIKANDVVANSSFEKLQNGSKITVSTMQLPSTTNQDNAP